MSLQKFTISGYCSIVIAKQKGAAGVSVF
jgi:hypothetical protein